jgi:hypothetical protein
MAYITKSNSQRIISEIELKRFSNSDLSIYKQPIDFFNELENNKLFGLKQLLQNPEIFIKDFYVRIVKNDQMQYVYEGGKPAYHLKSDCEQLNSNYRNYEIPEEIRSRGAAEITMFRNWFKENEQLIEKPDLFVARIQLAFGISIHPRTIERENSGVEVKENLNLEELEERIDDYILKSKSYYNEADVEKKGIIRTYSKNTYLGFRKEPIRFNRTRFSDDVLKNFLREYDTHFKRPVKELLTEYYRIKFNPELKFEGQLLEQLGFKPCSICHK